MKTSVEPYDERLKRDGRWALSEASRYFEDSGLLRDSLHRITRRLDDLKIPYAVAGALALFGHGYERFTKDVDILVTAEGLKAIHENLDGLGYVPPFAGSKNLRDVETGVRIEFLVAGQFPGDGKPKPVVFPNPAEVVFEKDGIKYLNLPTLIALKLASGMTNQLRMKDTVDVLELIKSAHPPRDLGDQLPDYVRAKFLELWDMVQQSPDPE